jgi:hypothetical protein
VHGLYIEGVPHVGPIRYKNSLGRRGWELGLGLGVWVECI